MKIDQLHNAKILIVDDDPYNTQLIEKILELNGYRNYKSVNDPRGVLALFIEYQPDLLILDLMMPHLDGFQVMNLISAIVGEDYLPILVVTAIGSRATRQQALARGAMDYVDKPFEADELCLRINNLIRVRLLQLQLQEQNRMLEERVYERTRELEDYQLELKETQIEVIVRLARAAEHRDDDTGQHTQRVGLTCSLLARNMGLTEEEVGIMLRAAPLHDVGKIGIPDSILLKPGRLDDEERTIMQSHCTIGADLLSGGQSELVQLAERIAASHHEKWDGSGYPRGLSGTQVPIEGRILAVADVFDALTHARPYKKAWPVDEAVKEIKNQRGRHFDPDIVDAFISLPHADLL
jgi:putative two-component system response regulator